MTLSWQNGYRRLLSIAVIIVLVSAAAGAGLFIRQYIPDGWMVSASRDAGLVLDQIQITGSDRTTQDEILTALDVEDGSPLMAIDIAALKTRLEDLNWVKSTRVARNFPNELSIDITERTPFALWQKDGVVQLVDPGGVVITDQSLGDYADLLLLVGDGAATEAGKLMEMLGDVPTLSERVRSAVRLGDRRWDVIMDNGIRVKLPASDGPYGPKAAWKALALLEERDQILARELMVIDLRIEDRLVLRLSPDGQKAIQKNSKKLGA